MSALAAPRPRTVTGRPEEWEVELQRRWLADDLDTLARDLNCSTRTLRRTAAKLGLGPRSPVKRALAAGADPESVQHRHEPSLPNVVLRDPVWDQPPAVDDPFIYGILNF